jgi:hypothetical protein
MRPSSTTPGAHRPSRPPHWRRGAWPPIRQQTAAAAPRRRYLHIPLVNAERAWAYSMDLKKEVENEGGHAPEKRHHSIRRLTKAAFWASELSRLASQVPSPPPPAPTRVHVGRDCESSALLVPA